MMSDTEKRPLDNAEFERPAKTARVATKERVAVIGSGNWGSVAARIAAFNAARHPEFEDEVRMWVFEEQWQGLKLSEIINETKENPKYLPGVKLGQNLVAEPELNKAVEGATMLIFVTPHQFVKNLCPKIKPAMGLGAKACSLIKGMDVTEDGFQLISSLITRELGVDCSVLMGANIANEIAQESFSEATVGYQEGKEASGHLWQRLFDTSYFHVTAVPDPVGVELCGTLKNIVALGAGFCDGLGLGNNSKAAIVRVGLIEMRQLAQECFPTVQMGTLFESAGVADLITTCYGGRNRRCAEAFVQAIRAGKPKSFEELEKEILNGQKLQGVLTSHEVQQVLKRLNAENRFPLFTTISRICTGVAPPDSLVRYAELRGEDVVTSTLKKAAHPPGVCKEKVVIIGSGNWGSVAARIAAFNAARHYEFEDEVKMWVFEEDWQGMKLSQVINETKENPKYLPGVKLGDNLVAEPDLLKAVEGATLLVFVTPHQFVKGLCPKIKPLMGKGARALSLIKGMDVTEEGFQLISSLVHHELGVDCSVLMGANIANEIAKESFSEATVGYQQGQEASGNLWQRLFDTSYFHVTAVPDPVGVELCGTLKNIVAVGAGFSDGLGLGNNSKAAIVRVGLIEMQRLAQECFPSVQTTTLFESAGVADLITTCYGGRNRRCAEAFVQAIRAGQPKTFEELEKELLNGQKLQGVLTSHEVQAVLRRMGAEGRYPLFTTIYRICTKSLLPDALVRYAELRDHGATLERTFLFSSESVNEGHPDKLCDQISDAVLDACLKEDSRSKVACETACKDNMIMVAGEITTQAKLNYEAVVRSVIQSIGFDSFVDDLSSVDSKGLDYKNCEVLVRINKQSPDIAGGVHVGKEDLEVGAGDQGIMFGYATDETEDCMPLTHLVATRMGKRLTDVRKSGQLWWLRPDGKTQVTIQYSQRRDGSMEPRRIHTIVISTQHAEPLKATRRKEVPGWSGPDETAPSTEEMRRLIVEEVVKKTLQEIHLKTGVSALTLFGRNTHLHINPSGKFIIGGPQGDAGLTGRKIIIDTYGGWGAHGGGAFSGKDPTKVDRSAAYICRQMAKSLVKSGLCKRAMVQLSYAIGVAKPLSLFVETYGSEEAGLTAADITNILKAEFDCRPGAIALSLALREPKYQETAAYCHFGRQPYTKDGIKFFEWENAKDLSRYRGLTSAQILAQLNASGYLQRWVD